MFPEKSWKKFVFLGFSKELWYNDGMKFKLIAVLTAAFAVPIGVGIYSNHHSFTPEVVVEDSELTAQQKIDALVNRVVPDGLPGAGMRYYESLFVEKKEDLKSGYVRGDTIQAVLYISDKPLDNLAFTASLWKGDDTPLHTWNLLQTRIAHTKELMGYLMELYGDVEDESMPSKYNYEVIVISNYNQDFNSQFEMGRRTKLCGEFGLFHLPKVSGPYFEQDWYALNAKRQRP